MAEGPRRSARRLEEEVGRTRAEIGRTLDALAGKLTARGLMEKGIGMVSHPFDRTDEGKPDREGLRIDAIPLALIGLGIAWLVASSTGVADKIVEDERIRALPRRLTDLAGRNGAGARRSPTDDDAAKGTAGLVDEPISDTTDGDGRSWIGQASGAARSALGSVRETGSLAYDRASTYVGSAGERASGLGGLVSDAFRRYPLLFGAAGMVVGAALARLLPPTREEEAWLGGARDAVWEKAEELGRETADRLRSAATPEAAASDSPIER